MAAEQGPPKGRPVRLELQDRTGTIAQGICQPSRQRPRLPGGAAGVSRGYGWWWFEWWWWWFGSRHAPKIENQEQSPQVQKCRGRQRQQSFRTGAGGRRGGQGGSAAAAAASGERDSRSQIFGDSNNNRRYAILLRGSCYCCCQEAATITNHCGG